MDRLLGTVITRALRRGMRGEPMWLVIGAGAWLLRRARRQPERTVWSGRVHPGDRLLITTFDPKSPSSAATPG